MKKNLFKKMRRHFPFAEEKKQFRINNPNFRSKILQFEIFVTKFNEILWINTIIQYSHLRMREWENFFKQIFQFIIRMQKSINFKTITWKNHFCVATNFPIHFLL